MKLKKNYKRFFAVFCLLWLFTMPLKMSAANPDANTLFQKGNIAYAKADYKSAISAYQQILKANQSADVYYNLGNAWFKDGNIEQAILYYERAHQLSPGDADINHNLAFAKFKINPESVFVAALWWRSFISAISLKSLAISSIICLLLASATLSFYLYAGSVLLKKVSFYAALVLFAGGVSFIFMSNRQAYYFAGKHKSESLITPQR